MGFTLSTTGTQQRVQLTKEYPLCYSAVLLPTALVSLRGPDTATHCQGLLRLPWLGCCVSGLAVHVIYKSLPRIVHLGASVPCLLLLARAPSQITSPPPFPANSNSWLPLTDSPALIAKGRIINKCVQADRCCHLKKSIHLAKMPHLGLKWHTAEHVSWWHF